MPSPKLLAQAVSTLTFWYFYASTPVYLDLSTENTWIQRRNLDTSSDSIEVACRKICNLNNVCQQYRVSLPLSTGICSTSPSQHAFLPVTGKTARATYFSGTKISTAVTSDNYASILAAYVTTTSIPFYICYSTLSAAMLSSTESSSCGESLTLPGKAGTGTRLPDGSVSPSSGANMFGCQLVSPYTVTSCLTSYSLVTTNLWGLPPFCQLSACPNPTTQCLFTSGTTKICVSCPSGAVCANSNIVTCPLNRDTTWNCNGCKDGLYSTSSTTPCVNCGANTATCDSNGLPLTCNSGNSLIPQVMNVAPSCMTTSNICASKGLYSITVGSSSICVVCPNGATCLNSAIIYCPSNQDTTFRCVGCAAGYYSKTFGILPCLPCGAGAATCDANGLALTCTNTAAKIVGGKCSSSK